MRIGNKPADHLTQEQVEEVVEHVGSGKPPRRPSLTRPLVVRRED
jgi:hypothetical protein